MIPYHSLQLDICFVSQISYRWRFAQLEYRVNIPRFLVGMRAAY